MNLFQKSFVLLSLFSVLFSFAAFADKTDFKNIFPFSEMTSEMDLLHHWHEVVFPSIKETTNYSITSGENEPSVLKASSKNSASGLFYDLNISVKDDTTLSWRWKIENLLKKSRLNTKSGDDHPVRIYLLFTQDEKLTSKSVHRKLATFSNKKQDKILAINYIWAKQAPIGSVTISPYSKRSYKVVAQSGSEGLGQWHNLERDFAKDYQKVFGEKPTYLIGVMLMTDTDNTHDEVISYYGDLEFKAS